MNGDGHDKSKKDWLCFAVALFMSSSPSFFSPRPSLLFLSQVVLQLHLFKHTTPQEGSEGGDEGGKAEMFIVKRENGDLFQCSQIPRQH